MALGNKTLKVLNYSEIPEELRKNLWLSDCDPETFVQCSMEMEGDLDTLDLWILDNYPELVDEDSFLVYIDEF